MSQPARADVIISNYPPANDDAQSTISSPGGLFSNAAGFTLPAGSVYSLDSVQLRLHRSDVDAGMTLDLFADIAGSPGGAPLASFVVPSFPLAVSDVVFTPSSPVTLLPSTTYWIAATGTSPTSSGIQWLASDPNITPTGIATSAGFRFDSAGSYPPTASSAVMNTYIVNATAVPEASAVLCLAVSSLVVAPVVAWRTRRHASGNG
jgi:hypothetical protein